MQKQQLKAVMWENGIVVKMAANRKETQKETLQSFKKKFWPRIIIIKTKLKKNGLQQRFWYNMYWKIEIINTTEKCKRLFRLFSYTIQALVTFSWWSAVKEQLTPATSGFAVGWS